MNYFLIFSCYLSDSLCRNESSYINLNSTHSDKTGDLISLEIEASDLSGANWEEENVCWGGGGELGCGMMGENPHQPWYLIEYDIEEKNPLQILLWQTFLELWGQVKCTFSERLPWGHRADAIHKRIVLGTVSHKIYWALLQSCFPILQDVSYNIYLSCRASRAYFYTKPWSAVTCCFYSLRKPMASMQDLEHS